MHTTRGGCEERCNVSEGLLRLLRLLRLSSACPPPLHLLQEKTSAQLIHELKQGAARAETRLTYTRHALAALVCARCVIIFLFFVSQGVVKVAVARGLRKMWLLF